MAFNPNSTIWLCNVPIDSAYKNQIYFANRTQQQEYFRNKVVKTFAEYTPVRTTLPDGGVRSSIKVDANIDEIRALPCNYMYYQNANHGSRIFYAFITQIIYKSEYVTEIVFETDVFQTWMLDCKLQQSYVVREHSESDEIGEHTVPEKFNVPDYNFIKMSSMTELDSLVYLVAATDTTIETAKRGNLHSGIYQGLHFHYARTVTALNNLLDALEDKGSDCIVFIAVVPEACLAGSQTIKVDGEETDAGAGSITAGYIVTSTKPAEIPRTLNMSSVAYTFDGYVPKNNKLFTAPYQQIIITNHSGDMAEYNIEDFADRNNMEFVMFGDVSANPSITMYPKNYKGLKENYDCGISISGFPQCAFNSDTFKLWLAKNQYGVALDVVGGLINTGVGAASAIMTGGVGAAIGGGQIASGITGILGSINNVYAASKEPNKLHAGSAKNNLLTAIGLNKFEIYCRMIKKNYAVTVDDFFTMYGYQTNCVKIPNVSKRPFFNYVQTVDVNITGGIPADDMERLKQVYNEGVTLWKAGATVGDYSVDNSPNK